MATQSELDNLNTFLNKPSPSKSTGKNEVDSLNEFLATPAKTQKDLGTQPTIKLSASKYDNSIGDPSAAKSFILGAVNNVGGGFNQLLSGAKDYGSELINDTFGTNLKTSRQDEVTKETKAVDQAYENSRKKNGKNGTDWWRVAGNVAAWLPTGALGTGKTFLGTAAKSSGLGAVIGGSEFAENDGQRAKNAAIGAVGGGIGGVTGKGLERLVGKAINVKKGNYKPGAKEVLDQGAKHNVRVSVGDVGQNPHIKRTESVLDRTPFIGTSKFREAQQKEAAQAVDKVIDGLHQQLSEVDYKSLDKIRAAASAGNPNAIRIMKVVNEAGNDTGKILQAAAEIKSWRGQRVASQMYDRVSQMAGDTKSPATNMLKAIDDVIAKDSKTIPNMELLSELNKIKSNWSNPNNPQNFRELQSARSRLGELVDEWGAGNKGTSGLSDIREAINADMDEIAKSSGNPTLLNEYKRANAFYTQLQDVKAKEFGKAMSSKTPDEIYNQFVKSGKGDRAANFYKSLDPKGQAALRYEMANQVLNKATDVTTGVFSPAVFAREFEKLNAPYSQIFTKNHKAEMDGFVKLMRHIEQAGQYSSNPTNGSMLLLPASGIGLAKLAMSEPMTAAATVGSIYGMSKLFTTNAGRRILLAAKDLPTNSQKLVNLLKQAQQLATVAGATSTQ
ncbi:hypothetical protein [Acinetobacter junii]|uniref:hypothetical protein n=1 Tax=Acinetobacter junii TaxID=40215 RepID=UPI00124FA2A2|nr:hypothetical protein [Acinetobacter junii]